MSSKRVSLFFLLVFLGTAIQGSKADAKTPQFEVFTGSLGNATLYSAAGSVAFQGSLFGGSVGSGLMAGLPNPSFGIHLKNGFEIILSPDFSFFTPLKTMGDQAENLSILVSHLTGGVAYNFSPDISNSLFLQISAGAAILKSGGRSSTHFAWNTQIGKRIGLTESIS
jgi:hypothetical protein